MTPLSHVVRDKVNYEINNIAFLLSCRLWRETFTSAGFGGKHSPRQVLAGNVRLGPGEGGVVGGGDIIFKRKSVISDVRETG